MNEKRFVVQIGMGIDQHGHSDDCTHAAIKAIKNAISTNSLAGLMDIFNLTTAQEIQDKMKVHVKIGAPFPDKLDREKLLGAIPFGTKSIEVVKGGLITEGVQFKELGDTSGRILICNASVEVSIIYKS